MGWSDRHVRNMVKLGGRAREEYKGAQWAERIRGTSAATHFAELREFFHEDDTDEMRLEIVRRLRSARSPKSVRAARAEITALN